MVAESPSASEARAALASAARPRFFMLHPTRTDALTSPEHADHALVVALLAVLDTDLASLSLFLAKRL